MKVYPAHAILPVRREEADLHRGFAAQAADPGPAPGGRGAEDSGGGIMDGHIITSWAKYAEERRGDKGGTGGRK